MTAPAKQACDTDDTHANPKTNHDELKSLYRYISDRVLIITATISVITIAFVIGIAVFQHSQANKAYQQLSDDLLIQGLRQQLTYFNTQATQTSLESFNHVLKYEKIAAYDRYNAPRGVVGSISDGRPADDEIKLYNDNQTVIGTLYLWKTNQPLIGGDIPPIVLVFLIGLLIIFAVCAQLIKNVIRTYATNPINNLTQCLDTQSGNFNSSDLPKSVTNIAELNELANAFSTIWQQRDQEVIGKEAAIESYRKLADDRKQSQELLERILISAKISLGYSNHHDNASGSEAIGFKPNEKIESILGQSNYSFHHVLSILEENSIDYSVVREHLDSEDKARISYVIEVWTDAVTVWHLSSIPISENSQALLAAEVTDLRMAEHQLFHHQKMDAVGELSSGIAHDFNNVLAIIVACIESSQLKPDSENDANLTLALQAANRASGLVKHLLNYANKERSEISEVNVGDMLENIASLVPLSLGINHRLKIDINMSPTVRCDADLLETTLINLIINARDAMPDGGDIHLVCDEASAQEVKQAHLNFNKRYLTISVMDNGPGISPDIEARLFDPFFTTKRRGEGTGMGLSIAYGFAKRSAGAISLDKTTVKGSKFNLLLPIQPKTTTDEEPAAITLTPTQQDTPPTIGENLTLQGLSIAIVDDEKTLANTLSQFAKLLGMTATVFYSIESLKQLLSSGHYQPDIVLSDIHLNDGTGYDVYSCLQEYSDDVTVVLMSGHKQLHANDTNRNEEIPFLQKPFTLKQFNAVLTKHVKTGAQCTPL